MTKSKKSQEQIDYELFVDNKKFTNTYEYTEFYDGIDLTMNQRFKEKQIKLNKPHIGLFDDVLFGNFVIETDDEYYKKGRFFYNELKIPEEDQFYMDHCERCGEILCTKEEKLHMLCSTCDRLMFAKTKAKKYFDGKDYLLEKATAYPKELWIDNKEFWKLDMIYSWPKKYRLFEKIYLKFKKPRTKQKRKTAYFDFI